MSVEHLAVVLHHSRAKGTAKLVLLGIANHAGDGGAWPSVATLAKYANTKPRQVQKCLSKLVELGELRTEVQAGGLADTPDWSRPNRYDVIVACPPWCDRSPQHRDTRRLAGPQPTLGINPLSSGTPPVLQDRGGVSYRTPGGVSYRTPKPSIEHTPTPGSASTTGRARVDNDPGAMCDVCSLTRWACESRATVSGHTFTPRRATA